ncbi:3'-5' exonuclease [Natrinema versiforme]|nr:3'-5' exonuclease [Natrinema versiforme]
MSSEEKYPVVGRDEYDVTESVKLDGPPGHGKTEQIKRRTEEFLKETDSTIHNVMLGTYRRSLSQDLINTFEDGELLPPNFSLQSSYMGTIHANCDKIIRKKTDLNISNKATGYAQKLFCQKHGLKYFGDTKQELTGGKALFNIFTWMVANKATPEQVPQYKYDTVRDACDRHIDIRRLWQEWQQFKQNPPIHKFNNLEEGDELYDFDESLLIVSQRELVPENVDLLIVDEMHDVYPVMNDVIQMWMEKMEDTTFIIAGDKNQVINQYQGTSPEFYEEVNLPEIHLPDSYRCRANHLEYAHSILSKHFEPPRVENCRGGGSITSVNASRMEYDNRRSEWRVPSSLNSPSSLYEEHVDDEETALYLVRTNLQAEAVAKDLERAGIPFESDSVNDWKDSGLLDLYNGLCTIREIPSDVEYTWDSGFALNLGDDTEIDGDELLAVLDATPAEYVADSKLDAVNVAEGIESYPLDNLHNFFEESFFAEVHANPVGLLLNSVDKKKLAHLADKHSWTRIHEDGIRVKLLTIHASKGMQGDNVFLYDGIPKRIQDQIEKSPEVDKNECRTWYVATTRASDTLVVVRNAFDGYEPSPYLPPIQTANGSSQSGVVHQ